LTFEKELIIRLIATIVVLVVIVFFRNLSLRMVKKHYYAHNDSKIRAVVFTRRIFFTIIVFAIIFIWLTQLRNFAFSIAAIAVAIVIATKEMILNVTAGFTRSYSQSYRIGDRIDIGGFRGDVVNIDMFTTTLLEIGPGNHSHQYTGRSIAVPNSLIFSKPVINETYTDEYILHIFTVPVNSTSSWKKAEELLLEAANEIVAEYLDDAKKHMEKLGENVGFDAPNVEPRVTLVLNDTKKYSLLVRVPVPSRRKGRIEQAILRLFLERWKKPKETEAENESGAEDDKE